MRTYRLAPVLLGWLLTSAVLASAAPPEPAAPVKQPATGVIFHTPDAALQRLFDDAETKEAGNVVQFTSNMKVLVEGGGYASLWVETQPMGGEMYAKRDLKVALNNQVIFMQAQRSDGRLPGQIKQANPLVSDANANVPPEKQIAPNFSWGLQGFCFPDPAWRMYFWIGKDKSYLQKLYDTLAAYDAYLWRTRDSNGDGLLEVWCTADTGEDGGSRYLTRNAPVRWGFETPPGSPHTPDPQNPDLLKKHWMRRAGNAPVLTLDQVLAPFASMDVMAYSYDARATLAKISRELGNGKEKFWQNQAEEVRQRVIAKLWNPARHACFDHDRTGKPLEELIHNNLRAMYHGMFSQQMADEFVHDHLLNPKEFWTPLPLPSVAANEPLFQNTAGNNWSGQPQGLTYQRAIHALENYGYYSIVTELGQKLIEAIQKGGDRFTQQLDPFSGLPSNPKQDGYGPTLLATLEYISRMHGVYPEVTADEVWWSASDGKEFSYSQRWGNREWTLSAASGRATASLNGQKLFSFTPGVRVVTNLEGKALKIVGIAPTPQAVVLYFAGKEEKLSISPNQIVKVP